MSPFAPAKEASAHLIPMQVALVFASTNEAQQPFHSSDEQRLSKTRSPVWIPETRKRALAAS